MQSCNNNFAKAFASFEITLVLRIKGLILTSGIFGPSEVG